MMTFAGLLTMANQINVDATPFPTDTVLELLAETKATCESYADCKYVHNDDTFNLRVCRDLCVAGLNSGENRIMLDGKFRAVKACLKSFN